MGANDGSVDHGIFVVGIGGQMLEYIFPYTPLRPTAQARMDYAKVAKALRQVAPRNTGAIAISTASTNRRLSLAGRPSLPFRPGNKPSMRCHWSSRNPYRFVLIQKR
jgi:hypothetical protein